jgi:alpha-tubulin suppressor-like RCC1 family protein
MPRERTPTTGRRFSALRGLAAFGVVAACLACCSSAGAVQISAGASHSCLVASSGRVECWGYNRDGELGDGTTTSSDVPVQVQGLNNAVEVAAGDGDSCAVLSSGRVACWGDKSNGELGDGSREGKSEVPIEVHGITNAIQVANGSQYACALLSSGHVDCWGDEVLENIGSERRTPVEVPGIEGATQIAVGSAHGCARLSSGHVECWGENDYGQLGNASTGASSSAVAVQSISTATQIAAGGDHSCALLASGHVSCWGDNSAGDLGDGTKRQSDVPVEVLGLTDATQVASGQADSCAVIGGHVGCWGANYYGELGDGTTADADAPVEVKGIRTATQIAPGAWHSCALLSGGYAECWGDNAAEELGDGTNGGEQVSPVAVHGLSDAFAIALGSAHSCAALSSGHVDCWGENSWGQLGDDTTERSQVPVEAQGVSGAIQVSGGPYDSCAVLSSGHVDCWGGNYFGAGELGNGANESSAIPVEVANLTNATQVATATFGSCARLSSGHVDCWGNNSDGELGDGTTGEPSDTPVEVLGISDAVEVAVGDSHSCALLSSGRVYCWGYNLIGQLGDGSQTASDVPVEVHGIASAIRIAATHQHSCAVLSSGRVYCWGANGNGQLGVGVGAVYGPEACEASGGLEGGFCAKTPVEAHGVTTATDVATGRSDSCALLSNGHADCWGSNGSGQLGSPVCEYSSCLSYAPVEVQGLSGAIQIAIDENDACAVLSSGQLDCWGSNWDGALGNNLAWSTVPMGVVGFAPPEVPTIPEPSAPPGGSAEGAATQSEQAPRKGVNVTGAGAPSVTTAPAQASVESTRAVGPSTAQTLLLNSAATETRRGRLSLALSCSQSKSECSGTLVIAFVEHPKHRKGSVTLLLARARYTLRPAGRAEIAVTLTRVARALLAEHTILRANVTVTTLGGAEAVRRISRLMIRAPRH